MPIIVMLVSAVSIIGLVKYGLVPGIDRVSASLDWSLKARGKATGYATSVPELVTLIAAGLSGVWSAGLWNIVSSNLINAMLAITVVVFYRRGGDLFHRRFIREIGFAVVGILAPLALMNLELDTHWSVVPLLPLTFLAYLFVDRGDGSGDTEETETEPVDDSSPLIGLIMCIVSLALIAGAGFFLGDSTRDVVLQMGVSPILTGWILGVVTSLPEAVTFFVAYSAKRPRKQSDPLAATQELLDNLAASNMSNSGLIYPLGLGLYLLVTGVAVS
jgi:Ca2+/Na+ antiporter